MHRGHQNQSILAKPIRSWIFHISQTLRHNGKKNFRTKSLVKKKVPTYAAYTRRRTFHYYDSHFTSLRDLFDGSKNQRNPMPKHVELQIISSYINQWPTDVEVRTFLRNLKIRQKLKKNNKANVPINKLFEEDKLFEKTISSTSPRICLKQRKHSVDQQARSTGLWKKGIKENSSSSLHTQWAIDQGATRLGGL